MVNGENLGRGPTAHGHVGEEYSIEKDLVITRSLGTVVITAKERKKRIRYVIRRYVALKYFILFCLCSFRAYASLLFASTPLAPLCSIKETKLLH